MTDMHNEYGNMIDVRAKQVIKEANEEWIKTFSGELETRDITEARIILNQAMVFISIEIGEYIMARQHHMRQAKLATLDDGRREVFAIVPPSVVEDPPSDTYYGGV